MKTVRTMMGAANGNRASPSAPRRSVVPATLVSSLPLLLLLLLGGPGSAALCPPGCVCACDILSCTALGLERVPPPPRPISAATLDLSHNRIARLEAGAFGGLPRLHTLRLAHNWLEELPPAAFRNSSGPRLLHLDLSSNRLAALDGRHFLELRGLQELLLHDNRLARVEPAALAPLSSLRRLYLGSNRLTDFPFFSLGHAHLHTLDLSANRLARLPLGDLAALPAALRGGLFLHDNPLACDCGTYALLRRWEARGDAAVRDFRTQLTCLLLGLRRAAVRPLLHTRLFLNCSQGAPETEPPEGGMVVAVGDRLLLPCATTLAGGGVSFLWVSPGGAHVGPGGGGGVTVRANGSLEIAAARPEDAGAYLCVALGRYGNETREVNVTVLGYGGIAGGHLHGDGEQSFSTGLTTLLGCLVSLLLVLMYLYLPPCRCHGAGPAPTPAPATGPAPTPGPAPGPEASILTPDGPGRRVSANKHVVFLEPIKEQKNGRLGAGP